MRLTVNSPRASVVEFGPIVPLTVVAADGTRIPVQAQLDTGASRSCVDASIAAKLGEPTGQAQMQYAGHEVRHLPEYICGIELASGTQLSGLCVVHGTFGGGINFLLGRDVLQFFKLSVDFCSGQIVLELPQQPS